MQPSRAIFLSRHASFRAATKADVIFTRAPTEVGHNARARLLRNGLAVVGYAIVEDFLRNRTGEVLSRIGGGATPFAKLPEGLRHAATLGTIDAIKFRTKFEEESKKIKLCQENASVIASSLAAAYSISPLSFFSSEANVRSGDVESVLRAFGVAEPWTAMQAMARKTHTGVISIKDAFDKALAARNIAAHQASADVETSDLVAFDPSMVAIAVSFDLLISKALRFILDQDSGYLTGKIPVAASRIKVRSIVPTGSSSWREVVEGHSKAFREEYRF